MPSDVAHGSSWARTRRSECKLNCFSSGRSSDCAYDQKYNFANEFSI
jgi:hypothetical protein